MAHAALPVTILGENVIWFFTKEWYANPHFASRCGGAAASVAGLNVSDAASYSNEPIPVGSIDGGYRIYCEKTFHLKNVDCK
jgi:hypothetical protein